MNNSHRLFLSLLSAAIRNRAPRTDGQNADWSEVFSLSDKHAVSSIIYPVLDKLDPESVLPADIKSMWRASVIKQAAHQLAELSGFERVLQELISQSIPVILYKGIVLQDLYPFPELRTMGDIDIIIHEHDLQKCEMTLEKAGYIVQSRSYRVIEYTHHCNKFLELHTCLSYPEKYKKFKYFEDHLWDHVTDSRYCGEKVLVLTPEFNLSFLVAHIYNHYCGTGVGLRQLCDLILVTEKYADQISWEKFWEIIRTIDIVAFTETVFRACGKYLNLSLENIPMKRQGVQDKVLDVFIHDLLDSGVFGGITSEKGIESEFLHLDPAGSKTRFFGGVVSGFIFPGKDRIDDRYHYAKKYPVLLPFAWIHRLIYTIFVKRGYFLAFTKKFSSIIFSVKRIRYLKAIGVVKD